MELQTNESTQNVSAKRSAVGSMPWLSSETAPTQSGVAALNYVVGFLFDTSLTNVALIEKQKPAWQRGKLNGIGGKIESGEAPEQAMIREFREETGLDVTEWRQFCRLSFRGGCIYFFMGVGELHRLTSVEDEQVTVVAVADIPRERTIQNLRWLIPMALDKDGVTAVVEDLS